MIARIGSLWVIGEPTGYLERQQSSADAEQRTLLRQQQTIAGTGWAKIQTEDRGNQSVTVEANTTRTFATALDRFAWVNSLSDLNPANHPHPWQADVFLREHHGAAWAEWKMPDAIISIAGLSMVGAVAVSLRYRFTAGGLTPHASGTYEFLLDLDGAPLLDLTGDPLEAAA